MEYAKWTPHVFTGGNNFETIENVPGQVAEIGHSKFALVHTKKKVKKKNT